MENQRDRLTPAPFARKTAPGVPGAVFIGGANMTIPLFHVDAFTDRPFSGNPAAVCILPAWKEAPWLQAVAAEMNLSETAFLVEIPDGYHLRWFTPKTEVDLCGHATLASAHVLWEEGHLEQDQPARLATRSGILTARKT